MSSQWTIDNAQLIIDNLKKRELISQSLEPKTLKPETLKL